MQCKLDPEQSLSDIPKLQKQGAMKSLRYYQQRYCSQSEAMARAYLAGHYTLKEVGKYFGVSYATVSRSVKKMECDL